MLLKKPASSKTTFAKKFLGLALIGEVALCGFSYFIWNRLNNDQDVRLYAYHNFRFALEGYYSLGEKLSGTTIQRETDLLTWEAQKKI